MPHNLSGQVPTREFLLKIVDILVDYINDVNDRDEKVLHFKHPEEMLRLLKLDIPDEGVPLQNLIDDCSLTLKHQVKTGKKLVWFSLTDFLKTFSIFERVHVVIVCRVFKSSKSKAYSRGLNSYIKLYTLYIGAYVFNAYDMRRILYYI